MIAVMPQSHKPGCVPIGTSASPMWRTRLRNPGSSGRLSQQQEQAWLLREYQRVVAILSVLLRQHAPERRDTFEDTNDQIIRFIESQRTMSANARQMLQDVNEAMHWQMAAIDALPSETERTLLVPNTDALYGNPELEQWRVPWTSQPEAFVLTQLIQQIMKLQLFHRSPQCR